jgi:vacuole morphology and inheritance protein 14
VISNDQTTSRPLSTSAPSQQPPPRPVRRKPDGNRATPPVQNRFHQPHGAAATGPTPAVVSSSGHSYLHGHLGFPSYQQQPPGQPHVLSMESPLPPVVQRGLGDRSNDKRKNAALEIEALIKSLQEANNIGMIRSVITVLSNDFCTSMNSNYRKGGLIGLAATAIGLHQNARNFLNALLPPVLHCFDDPEARVRYYACESVYNIAKVSRQFILTHFNQIFEGLAKLFADVDVDVKNGANLLDKLVKDIVTETETFHVEQFLPLLQNYIRRTNPYIRQLLVGWITVLDTIPDISMIDYLPEFLDGLFNMLSDSNREIRQAADSALSDFLREVTVSAVVEFGPIISILVVQCRSKERLNRLTAETWLSELIHHPYSGGDALLPIQAEILGAVLWCISDEENEIRLVAERTNDDCMTMVRETSSDFELKPLLDTLTNELLHKDDVPTKLAALGWINMLMEKRKADMNDFTEDLLPVLLRTLSDPSDAVILLDLQVLSRISLAQQDELGYAEETEEIQFQMVLNAILNLFAKDRRLLETRGSLIIRKLCVLLNAKSVYIRMADTMASYEMKDDGEVADIETLQFVSTMVQTLNLILLTASELQDLRTTLATAFTESSGARSNVFKEVDDDDDDDGGHVFATLFHCWAHNPIATFSLCLLARTYDLSFCLIKRFSDMPDVSVGFLMQIDKLVHLLESPIFLQLRLQLLDVESPCHAPLLKSIYGLLMCLPQGNAFRLLNERLATVCNLRDNLGVQEASTGDGSPDNLPSIVSRTGLSMEKLLERFDNVDEQHHKAKNRSQGSVEREKDVEAGTGASGTHPAVVEDSAQLGHIKPPSIADAFGVSREDEERTQHPLTRVSSDAKDSPDRPNMQQPIS